MNKAEFESRNKYYSDVQSNLHNMVGNQQELNMRGMMTNDHFRQMGGSHTVGDRAQTELIRKLGVFASIFPPKERPDGDDPLGKEARWSPEQLEDIADGLEAFFKPNEVLLEYVTGNKSVSDISIDVLKNAHPSLVNKIKNELLNGMYGGHMKFSYKDKIKLSELFDMPLKSIMSGEAQLTVSAIWSDQMVRRQNLMKRGMSLPSMVDVRDAAAARAASIRG